MPCNMNIYEGQKATLKHNLGKGRRNTLEWSHHGRYYIHAGFGNLAGEIDFCDRGNDNKKLGSTKFECCVIASWSPDGKLLLGATTFPRMKVDNCIQLLDYTGEPIGERMSYDT